MREPTIARNYAEALFESAEKRGQAELFADLMDAFTGAVESDDQIKVVMESPRIPKAAKMELVGRALAEHAPGEFVAFIRAVIKRGRQSFFPAIRDEYNALVDIKLNRVHAGITLAREPNEDLQDEIVSRLGRVLEKEVIPHYRIDPRILGGLIVRVGDRVMDGSIRRKMVQLRDQMLGT